MGDKKIEMLMSQTTVDFCPLCSTHFFISPGGRCHSLLCYLREANCDPIQATREALCSLSKDINKKLGRPLRLTVELKKKGRQGVTSVITDWNVTDVVPAEGEVIPVLNPNITNIRDTTAALELQLKKKDKTIELQSKLIASLQDLIQLQKDMKVLASPGMKEKIAGQLLALRAAASLNSGGPTASGSDAAG